MGALSCQCGTNPTQADRERCPVHTHRLGQRDEFLRQLTRLCREHGISIDHEDSHGAFLLRDWNLEHEEWILAATDTRKEAR